MEAEVSEILPGLYVGGLSSLKYLEALGITHVLSVLNFPLKKDLGGYFTLQLPLQDSPDANMLQYLPAAIKFLDAALPLATTTTTTAAAAAAGAGGAGPCSTSAVAPSASEAVALTVAGAVSTAGASMAAAESPPAGGEDGVVDNNGSSGGSSGGGGGGSSSGVSYRVLVHCQAGVSRSPAVVAAWLMRSRGLSADEALRLLGSRRPAVDPNEGFRAQLSLFGDMKCSLVPEHPVYKMWCLQELASRWEEQGFVDPVAFGQLPEGPTGLSAAVAAQQTLYRCRKCRTLLATSEHVMPVEAAMGHRIFRDRQSRFRLTRGDDGSAAAATAAADGGGGAESCLFVQPMQWMAGTVTGVVAGKLHCPKCSARLGSFNWSGISNPSGAWVTPAFQLHHSKLDTVLPKPLEAFANVRRPLVGPFVRSAVAAIPTGAVSPPTTAVAATSAPSLPATLPAAVRRMGLGRAGAGDVEEDEEQLPEPQLVSEPSEAASAVDTAQKLVSEPTTTTNGDVVPSTVLLPPLPPPPEQRQQQQQQPPYPEPGSCKGYSSNSTDARCGDGGGGGSDCRTTAGRSVAATAAAAAATGPATARFTHLILDCDGVLVDSEAASCEALRLAILEVTGFDIPHTFPYDYVEVFGMDVRSCVAHYREKFNRADWEVPELVAPRVQAAKEVHYKRLTEGGVRAFDGAERLIRRALDAGMQVGVASSGAPEKIAHNLTSSGLAPLIPQHAIVSASHVAAGKPAPDVYLAAMRATGCQDPRRALVVEDAVNGLKAARTAGMFAVGITNQLPAAVLEPWADLVVQHLDQVDPAAMAPPPALEAEPTSS